jgi:hypothetical protein
MCSCRTIWWPTWAIVGGICAGLTLLSTARADVEIRTQDGRVLTGMVDSRTTDDVLWIRQESDSIILATPVLWTAIDSASVDGQPIDIAQLAEQRDQLATEARFGFLLDEGAAAPIPEAVSLPYLPHRRRVTSLEINADLVNLDRTVEPDGYELVIAAVDESGQNIPVRGELYVRLMGERDVHHTGRILFQDLQRWSLPVVPHDFEGGVAAYVLPFRDVEPEFDDELCTSGQINVRLGVVGDGDFAATVPVVLREFNPYRDRLQMFQGSRFFRDELSKRVLHDDYHQPGIYQPNWPH